VARLLRCLLALLGASANAVSSHAYVIAIMAKHVRRDNAILTLLDRGAWKLPGWLDRRLPHVDIEGAKLGTMARAPSSAPDHAQRQMERIAPPSTGIMAPVT
jgi:hypothetical protein